MEHERAKDILELCRPDHVEDLNDPLIAEALEQLDKDSELSIWFEEQQIKDEEIRTELNRITPPAGLKKSILDEMRASSASSETHIPAESVTSAESDSNKETSTISSPIYWFRPWMGIAALFVFASVFLVLQNSKNTVPQIADRNGSYEYSTTSDSFRAGVPDIIQFLGQQIENFNHSTFSKRSEKVDELTGYLELAGMPSPANIPQSLVQLPTIGCVTFDYNGTSLSMICFRNKNVYHLITVEKANLNDRRFPDLSAKDVHLFEHLNQVFKVWAKNDQIYILTTKGTKEDISNAPEFI